MYLTGKIAPKGSSAGWPFLSIYFKMQLKTDVSLCEFIVLYFKGATMD